MDLKGQIKALQEQEQELERLRALLRPQYWPRIYELLKRVREQLRDLEGSLDKSNRRDIA